MSTEEKDIPFHSSLMLSIISKALAEEMEMEDQIKIVIDLNFKYKFGLAEAKSDTMQLIEEIGILPNCINEYKTGLSPQHILASMTAEEITRLAEAVFYTNKDALEKASKDEDTAPNDFVQRPVFMIWPDFELDPHVLKSVATVKADAAQRSFDATGGGIVWAVIDSGIDGDHLHFARHNTLDLSGLEKPLRHIDFTDDSGTGDEKQALTDEFGHGTHVAGIIAGGYVRNADAATDDDELFSRPADVFRLRQTPKGERQYKHSAVQAVQGIAPRCKIVSYKVLDDSGKGEVSNILAALAHIQEVNEQGRWLRIHGVNLSVGYGFNPEWFACGQSPVCVEVNRLVRSGVVVVVSAGNTGYGTRRTTLKGNVRSGMLMTINDPGNAELAITVGSTHREMPHVYGTSYFSSKGPTGDGRRKPDLLAPGERIISSGAGAPARERMLTGDRRRLYIDQSGTSMAAPHVSGAIAAFLSIRREFIGQPEKVKDVFTETATDLGREPYMQGAGLLDLMRAIQSV